MVACALIPRLSLTSALGERRELLGRPLALAPEPGGPQVIGEVSGPAEAFGVRAGMRLAEALGRCPSLTLLAADPVRAEALAERALRRLESIGAAVEPGRPGEAFFAVEGLRGLYGTPELVLAKARRALGPPVRIGAGPNRHLRPRGGAADARPATAADRLRAPGAAADRRAAREGARRPDRIVAAARSRRALRGRGAADRGGVARRRARAARDPDARRARVAAGGCGVADRFGELGLRALRLARGADQPLRPRSPHEELRSDLALPEAASGQQLERALDLLIERLLAHRARAARTFRRLRLEARLAAGGGWRTEVAMRSASASAERLRLALSPKLGELPGPASRLGLRALELGPEAADQGSLHRSPDEERRGRLTEAVRQVRAAAGRDAVLRVLEVDPGSRIPERRATLTPFGEGGGMTGVYWPRPVAVEATGRRRAGSLVGGVAVEAIRESWLVEDRWWTPKPLQRRYFEVILTDGRDIVVFREPTRRRPLVRTAGMTYTELHAHSSYSFLDGASLPEELATRATNSATRRSPSPTTTASTAPWNSPRLQALGLRIRAELTVTRPAHGPRIPVMGPPQRPPGPVGPRSPIIGAEFTARADDRPRLPPHGFGRRALIGLAQPVPADDRGARRDAAAGRSGAPPPVAAT